MPKKNLTDFTGNLPYASELYGLYQPLLGWRSRLTQDWMRHSELDDRVRRILDAHLDPMPRLDDTWFHPEETLWPASGRHPYSVLVAPQLGSLVLERVREQVEVFVHNHGGRLPDGQDEWNSIIHIDGLHTMLMEIENELRGQMQSELKARYPEYEVPEEIWAAGEKRFDDRIKYESQISSFLLFHAEGHEGFEPNVLQQVFRVQVAPPLSDILRPGDPLAEIDPNDTGGSLSPVGLVQIFRQYFFEFGTFLGEPVEHIWLAPGTTTELIEVSTRRTLSEFTTELTSEIMSRVEQSASENEELSEAIRHENQLSTKLGVSSTQGANLYVYQGSGTASFGLGSSRTRAREETHKQTHSQSQTLTNELKKTYKTTFRTVTEVTDTRSRRYVIENRTEKLVNYELRRKMRHVGIQLQNIGTQLCWQFYIDDPGAALGVAELVHVAQPAELAKMTGPELTPEPADIRQPMQFIIPFKPFSGDNDTGNTYEADGPRSVTGHIFRGDVNDKIWFHYLNNKVPVPAGFQLKEVAIKSVAGNHLLDAEFEVFSDSFNMWLNRVFFPIEGYLTAELELTFTAAPSTLVQIRNDNQTKTDIYNADKVRIAREQYIETIRDRITVASNIKRRKDYDLREEERTVVYRQLIERLMLDSWKKSDRQNISDDQRRLNHVRSEVIRAIFDVDSMLYFVAPEWWMPRKHNGSQDLTPPPIQPGLLPQNAPSITLTDEDTVGWGGIREKSREDNYMITEDSAPARLGSSLGWLLQLDGDNLRNAFLNSPWVKAIIPVRPGREKAALNWLKEVDGVEGWDVEYIGSEPEYQGKTIGEVLELIAEDLERKNSDFENVLATEKVFEFGFDPLEKAFDDTKGDFEVFSQWSVVLPTEQIVAVPYDPDEHL